MARLGEEFRAEKGVLLSEPWYDMRNEVSMVWLVSRVMIGSGRLVRKNQESL